MSIRAKAALVVPLLLTACYTPGGGWYPYSGGPKTYYSYQTRPVSIRLVDLRDDSVVFSMDVPAGKQLVYDFVPGSGDDVAQRPDLMRFEVFPIGRETGSLTNSITVPGQWDRRVDVYYREGEMMASPVDESLRTDTPEDRPDWWSPEGGQKPRDTRGLTNYDG